MSVKDNVGDLHGTIATIILIVAGLHAAAGLFHHYVWRDGTLRRMIPGLRPR
jgi:cytochrome b561